MFGKCPWNKKETIVGNDLLTPTRIYVKDVMKLMETVNIKGMSHITGGGIPENVPRMFPKHSNLGVHVLKGSWDIPEVFQYIQKKGYINENEMRRVFNMGIGFVLVINKEDIDKVVEVIPDAKVIGMVVKGVKGVQYV